MRRIKTYHLFEASKKIMYHATDGSEVKSILTNGLISFHHKKWPDNDYPEGIYFFDNVDVALRYAVLICTDGEVLEVDVTGFDVRKDPEPTENSNFEDAESFYTEDNIPASRIKLLNFSEEEKDSVYRQFE